MGLLRPSSRSFMRAPAKFSLCLGRVSSDLPFAYGFEEDALGGVAGAGRDRFLPFRRRQQDGDVLLNMAVLGACLSYVLMNLSHVILRLRQPNMKRGWKTPGGALTTGVGLVLSAIAVVSTFFVDAIASMGIVCVLAVGCVYFFAYARKRLISNAPEESYTSLRARGRNCDSHFLNY